MRLTLTVPEQHDLDDPRLELDVRKLERSLSELPMLDPTESLYRLTGYVEPLNEQRLDSALRYELLNKVAPNAQALFDVVAPDNLNWRRMTAMQQDAVIDGIERLSLALADGYKIVLKHWFAEAVPSGAPKLYAQAVRRTCRQLGNVLVHAYRCERGAPAFARFELYQLYRLGRHFKLLDLAGSVDTARRAPSLGEHCVALMLLAAIHERLRPAEIAPACHALLSYAGAVQLRAEGIDVDGPAYAFDLNSDAPPRKGRPRTPANHDSEPCTIDARPLAEVLLKRLATIAAGERETRIEGRLLDALLGLG